LYAPKGVGVLYIRKGIQIQPFILGAGHENGRRAGTENVIEIVGLGKACEILNDNQISNSRKVKALRDKFYNGLIASGIGVILNGHPDKRLPNTLNVSFAGIESSKLIEKIPGIAVSAGSACHANSKVPSSVLTAMGIADKEAFSAIRFSFGMFTTKADVDYTLKMISKALKK